MGCVKSKRSDPGARNANSTEKTLGRSRGEEAYLVHSEMGAAEVSPVLLEYAQRLSEEMWPGPCSSGWRWTAATVTSRTSSVTCHDRGRWNWIILGERCKALVLGDHSTLILPMFALNTPSSPDPSGPTKKSPAGWSSSRNGLPGDPVAGAATRSILLSSDVLCTQQRTWTRTRTQEDRHF
ncbi:unnamed protein product [Pleuronectes platessa]|uniref:Small membrane A-kinase anchor protein n=1 Tax=Pleuronectes platessa TaxID=8262 RepID=A0A9N7V7D5_PLEPL|nr:unnamed protein product [Pleuronectes platessa]